MKIIVAAFLVLLTGFSACSSKSNKDRKPVTNIQITPSNKTISYGDHFSIKLSARFDEPEISELKLYIDDRLLKTVNDKALQFTVNDTILPGQHVIKAVATNTAGKTGSNYVIIKVVSDTPAAKMGYQLIESISHPTENYTQGFEFHKGILFEGTGNYDESYVHKYLPDHQTIDKSIKLEAQYFGEGITILNGKIYQLTYKSRKGMVYDLNTFEKIDEFSFSSKEGWGLTNDGQSLIMSDGSSKLFFLNPENFEVEKVIEATYPNGFVKNLNELEYVDGIIYANIWTSETIAKIDANTGIVLAFINMSGLLQNFSNSRIDVLNGIAYHPEEELFYITGKWWPRTFKVRFE